MIFWVGVVLDFVDVVPGGRVEDVSETFGLALGEDGKELMCSSEGSGTEIETMEVTKVGLMAWRGR